MNFAQPIWLIAGFAACGLLWWRYRLFARRQRVELEAFASPHLVQQLTRSVSMGRRRLKHVLVIAGVACLFIALARPQAGYRWEEAHRKGLDILFAVDTSKSMLTQDVKPDRLTRAKLAVDDLVDKLSGSGGGGDDVGLIAFAGDAFLQSPMTLDYDAFRESLNALDTSVIPRGGTDISRAIGEAQTAFSNENDHDKILILLTDGEDLEGNAVTAAEAAARDGVKIFTVGVGTKAGDLIPVPSDTGGTGFIKDESGQFVKSRLDETILKKIAQVTGGMYEPLGQRGEGLTAIYNQGLAPFTRHDLASRQHRVSIERFEWPLLAGLCCLLADFFIGTRKRVLKRAHRVVQESALPAAAGFLPRRPKFAVTTAIAGMALAVVALPGLAHASPQTAEKAYAKGDYKAAEQEYQAAAAKAPTKTELDYNIGSAAYKAAQYDKAAEAFKKSLSTDQLNLQQDTYYNLGNTQYRLGQQAEKTDPKQAIAIWQQAIQSYDAALQLKPDDADSKFNRDLVQKKLDQLKQQQQGQQQQNKDNQNQQKQDQKNQDKSNQNQSGKEQKNQDQSKADQNGKDQKGQGQARQDQTGKDQTGKDQKNQGQSKQDQKDSQQKNPDQQKQAGNQPDQPNPDGSKQNSEQQAKANPQAQAPKPEGQDKSGGEPQPEPQKAGADQSPQQPVPGQMTKAEAKALLDSVKNDEHQLPGSPAGRNAVQNDNTPPLKDW
jgi:Ca-activated chloride channel family protein